MKTAITFDDVVLIPKFSELESRYSVDISSWLGNIKLEVPLISSPMDTVTGGDIARFMGNMGGIGIIHRYMPIEDQVKAVNFAKGEGI